MAKREMSLFLKVSYVAAIVGSFIADLGERRKRTTTVTTSETATVDTPETVKPRRLAVTAELDVATVESVTVRARRLTVTFTGVGTETTITDQGVASTKADSVTFIVENQLGAAKMLLDWLENDTIVSVRKTQVRRDNGGKLVGTEVAMHGADGQGIIARPEHRIDHDA